ncbi:MAG: hypothetical protein OEW33_14470 [Nitrospirota bacterium]|nr:hypothetical protein [Nitrospirota bacterium]
MMKPKGNQKVEVDKRVPDIKRATHGKFSAEEKIFNHQEFYYEWLMLLHKEIKIQTTLDLVSQFCVSTSLPSPIKASAEDHGA